MDDFMLLLHGAATTVVLAAIAGIGGVGLAIGAAAPRRSNVAVGRAVVATYVELVRNTPFLVQLFFIFFALPVVGSRLICIRSGRARDDTQPRRLRHRDRACRDRFHRSRPVRSGPRSRVARPRGVQADRAAAGLAAVYPALVSQVVIMLLESAVVSTIAVRDLTYAADFIQSRNFRAFETYVGVTVIYLLLAVATRRLLMLAGRRLMPGRPA